MAFWADAEAALFTWAHRALQTANGGTAVPVLWNFQNPPRGGKPFARLQRLSTTSLGSTDQVVLRPNPAGSPPAGQELEYDTSALKEFLVSLQVFTDGVTGDTCAQALVEACQVALGRESYTQAFADAGVVVADKGTVQNLTALLETKYEGRAVLTARFRAGIQATEFGGYIGSFSATGTFQP